MKKITLVSLVALSYSVLAPRTAHALAVTGATLSNISIPFETSGTPTGTTVQFSIDAAATCQVQVFDTITGSLVAAVTQDFGAAGAQTIFWDGLWLLGGDRGRRDGNYAIQVAATAPGGATSATGLVNSILSITSVDVHTVLATPSFDASGQPAFPYSISYRLAKDSQVTVTVKDSTGTVVRTLVSNQFQSGESVSSHTITWDGLNNANRPVKIGPYTVTIDAFDSTNGDHAITRIRSIGITSLSGVGDPNELFDNNVFVYPNPVRNGQATFQFQAIRDNATVHLKIYTLTGDLVRSYTFPNLAVGNITQQSWDATNEAGRKVGRGLYYYVVREDDSQGTLQTTKKMAVIQ